MTGAGDMVLSTLAMTLAAGCDYDTAVELANIAGGIEVEKFGNKTVTIEEMIDEIVSRNRTDGGKIRSSDSLTDELAWHRRRKKTVVFTNGCFDVLHSGHIEFLKFCKSQGDVVVVGLNSDNSVKTIKGSDRPINNQKDRAAVLAALEMVDYIVPFNEKTPYELITTLRPNILIKGADYTLNTIVGRDEVESWGGMVKTVELVEGKSTKNIVETIIERYCPHDR